MEAILKYLGSLPSFVPDFLAIVSGPKTFLRSRNTDTPENWGLALRFFWISGIIFLIISQMAASVISGNTHLLVDLIKLTVVQALSTLVAAAVIKLGWTLVGGKAPFRRLVLTHLYVHSVLWIAVAVLVLYMAAVFRSTTDPQILSELHNDWFKDGGVIARHEWSPADPRFSALGGLDPGSFEVLMDFWYIGTFAAIVGWLFLTWGAYRELNNASGLRSLGAFIISFAIYYYTIKVTGVFGVMT
jgi:hypothetical protein